MALAVLKWKRKESNIEKRKQNAFHSRHLQIFSTYLGRRTLCRCSSGHWSWKWSRSQRRLLCRLGSWWQGRKFCRRRTRFMSGIWRLDARGRLVCGQWSWWKCRSMSWKRGGPIGWEGCRLWLCQIGRWIRCRYCHGRIRAHNLLRWVRRIDFVNWRRRWVHIGW